MEEDWKVIPEYPTYEFSNFGRARHNGRPIKLDTNYNGYIWLFVRYKPVKKLLMHRVVAKLFLKETYKEGLVVNHKDGNKGNNVVTNLEWVTRSQNNKHAFKNHLKTNNIHKRRVKVTFEDGTEKIYESVYDCADDIGVQERRLHHLIRYRNGHIPELNAHVEKLPSMSNDQL